MTIFPGITGLSKEFKGVLLDAYGVFWAGNARGDLPGAKEGMERLVSDGKIVGILSNSTQLASNEIQKLHAHKIIQGKHFHFLVTSGEIAKLIFLHRELPFETPKNTFWIWGGAHPQFSSHKAIFDKTPYVETKEINEADFIYLSIPHINGQDQTDVEVFRESLQKLPKHLPMVCPNPDRFAHEGDPPRAVVRQGSIAALYEEMGGSVFYIGKPHDQAYTFAMKLFKEEGVIFPADILMVGDTPETDIRGAKRFGMGSALVMRTGIMADRIERLGEENALQKLSQEECPDFLIERLADDV